jgi:hypothetical protein
MRQTASKPQNPVASKLIFPFILQYQKNSISIAIEHILSIKTQGPLSVRALHVSNKPTNKNNEIHKQYKI